MGKLSVALVATCAVGLVSIGSNARADGGDAPFEVVTSFVSGVDIPESVTTDSDGNLYVSVGSTIQKRIPTGEVSLFATLPVPVFALGLKVGSDGCVYNASTSLSAVPGAFVWRICTADAVEMFAELDQSGGPNDLAFDDEGNLFVTDPVLGRIWKLDPDGNPEVFADDPLLDGNPTDPALVFRPVGVNGIALDKYGHFLYVSNTDSGSILRLDTSSSTGVPSVFVEDAALRGADGIAFDRSGKLFVAVNSQDALVSVSPSGRVNVLAQGGLLDGTSSLVFGAIRHDRHELYVVSSAFSRTLGFQPGTPQPALLARHMSTRGLSLP